MAFDSYRLEHLEQALRSVARLVGPKQHAQNENGFVEGLDLIAEANSGC